MKLLFSCKKASVPKVLAKIMGHELLQFLKPAVLQSIDPAQYGFIPGSSPMHALISMFHWWLSATDGTGPSAWTALFDFIC